MSLHTQPIQPVPGETARVARVAFPKGNPYAEMRDSLGTLFTDEDFGPCSPPTTSPPQPPGDWH